ncbi:hypothetical protein EAF04_008491 [Stromatinia cepivora]|nr:hypothetical protein EAF04_008491 [Stromatinia cepivora]
MISLFTFQPVLAFEDSLSNLNYGLMHFRLHCGLGEPYADILTQYCRLKAMNNPAFKEHTKLRRSEIVSKIYDALQLLVGANDDVEKLHEALTDITMELHPKAHSYTWVLKASRLVLEQNSMPFYTLLRAQNTNLVICLRHISSLKHVSASNASALEELEVMCTDKCHLHPIEDNRSSI